MSWYLDMHIGELRPWPDAVYVWRGKTGESQRYLPDDFCALARENNELRELVRDLLGELHTEESSAQRRMALADHMCKLGIEVNA